jgi:hypothetical protein
MTTLFAVRILCVLAVSAAVVLALQPTLADAPGQPAVVQRTQTYAEQQEEISAWTIGLPAGRIEGVPLRLAAKMTRVDDGADLHVLPIVTLGTTEKLYLRGADMAIINSGACSLLAQAERLECLEKLSRDIAPPPGPAMSPSRD